MVSIDFYLHPFGEDFQFDYNIFQMCWFNHQQVKLSTLPFSETPKSPNDEGLRCHFAWENVGLGDLLIFKVAVGLYMYPTKAYKFILEGTFSWP